jgi:ribosomal protein S18 acetylase RimI-like enzyme
MDDVRIRAATAEDIPFLRRMQWEALLASPQFLVARGLDAVRQIEDRYWARWPPQDETALVAEDAAGRPLGALILHVHERDGRRVVGYRLALGVEEHARGRGIGRRLLERAKRATREMGADYLLLLLDPTNEPALRAYQAAGFQPGDQYNVVPMIVRMADAAHTKG